MFDQSIDAFVYGTLGDQFNVCSSILGEGGRVKEAQSEFVALLEYATRQPDLAKSMQRDQLAIDQAKAHLHLVAAPGLWLLPSRMVINTEKTATYNNKPRQATPKMKLGINNDVNTDTKRQGPSWKVAHRKLNH